MNRIKFALVLLVGFSLLSAGCWFKKSNEQANLTGMENTASTEELAQLPQATTTSTQQTGVEVLPIETSPVTQSAPLPMPSAPMMSPAGSSEMASVSGSEKLSHEKDIQTALKNAGLYHGSIDGKIGPATKKAIETFQANHGLKADGKVGSKTWAILQPFLNSNASAASNSSASDQ